MEINWDEVEDTDCVYRDTVYPEHDWSDLDDICRRCGAEANVEDDE